MPYNPANLNNKVKPTFEEAHETSINSEEKESFVVDDRWLCENTSLTFHTSARTSENSAENRIMKSEKV